jgi:hypothetical protein
MLNLKKLISRSLSIEEAAKKIIEKVAHSSFKFFKDEEVREILNFSEIDQLEQNRIFNELVVTGLSLSILMTETISDLSRGEKSVVFGKLHDELLVRYPNWLRELGIEKCYLDQWVKLIEMRCDEYRKDFEEQRRHFPDPEKTNPWTSVVVIGGLHHLRRGKVLPEDLLFKHLLAWLGPLTIEIEKIMAKVV